MIKIENVETGLFETAMRGMRNPKNSWHLSDSDFENENVNLGEKDLDLAKRLIKGGPEHRKMLRQIAVGCDIVAPMYWWAEMDTYKVGTTRDSCSFMHKGASKEYELSDFTLESLDCPENESSKEIVINYINHLNDLRVKYNETKDMNTFRLLRQLLPSGYNYRATWTANYEVLYNIYRQRKNHRLSEWREFCAWIETLPGMKEFLDLE